MRYIALRSDCPVRRIWAKTSFKRPYRTRSAMSVIEKLKTMFGGAGPGVEAMVAG
jgi:hypothetical protein